MSHILRLIVWLLALLIPIIVVYGVYNLVILKSAQPVPSDLVPILQAIRNGNEQAAIDLYETIQNDPSKNAGDKALATLYILNTSYSLSGDGDDSLEEVKALKKIINDPLIIKKVRAAAVNVLGNEYNVSGKNLDVVTEIYKDEPFRSYEVPGDPELSSLNLQKWSYDMFPSSAAAISVAQIASGRYFSHPDQPASTTAAYVAMAEDYLGKAEAAVIEELEGNPQWYVASHRYMIYRSMRAITIGRLAITKGEPYRSAYRREFDDFFAHAEGKKSAAASKAILSTRFQYARVLAADKDEINEKIQLDQLAQALNSLQDPDNYPLVLLFKNEYLNQPTGLTWTAVKRMATVSPDFKVAVERLTVLASTHASQ